jgi:hypothetical protein
MAIEKRPPGQLVPFPSDVGRAPVSIFDDPEHWRSRAEEARSIAGQMSDPEAKRMMLGIAAD